jgi:hypothetical protein
VIEFVSRATGRQGCRLKRRVTWVLFGLLPMAALGQTAPNVPDTGAVVEVGNCTAPGAANLPRSLRNSLKSLGTPLLSEAETVAPLGGESLRSMPELKKALADARDDFINGQVDRAQKSLQMLAEEVGRLPPSAERWDLQRNVLTSLAQILDRSDKPAAQATLRRIFAVDPDYAPDPSVYPPSFLAEVAKAKGVLQQSPTNTLQVTTDPSGTPVAVGGRPMGSTPLSIRLTPGTYRVEGMWGYRGLSRSVDVGAPPEKGAQMSLSKAYEGSILPDAGPCILPVPTRESALTRFAALVKVKKLYAIRTETSGTEQTVVVEEFDATTGRDVLEKREPVVPPGPVSDAATRVAQELTATSPIEAKGPPSDVNQSLRLWSYIIGGVGVAATTVGVILFISGNSTINNLNSQYTQGGNTFPAGFESSFQSQNNSGKNDKTIGVIVGGAGVAALATGITLFFVSAHGGGASNVAIAPFIQPGSGGAVIAGRF